MTSLCFNCLGCNKLEDIDFEGIIECIGYRHAKSPIAMIVFEQIKIIKRDNDNDNNI